MIPVMILIWYIPWFDNTMIFEITDKGENGFFYGLSAFGLFEVIIFILASVTDFFDGYIARKKNLVTSFGKFLDPLADKMLVFTAMIILMLDFKSFGTWYWNLMPLWALVIMLVREFSVSGIRMLVASKGVVMPAAFLGKFKTFTTMIAIIFLFFAHTSMVVAIIGMVLMYIACLFTILSGVEYFWKSRNVILESI